MPPKKPNAINSVVSDLIRAAAGASARDIADEDVDKYVADLILKEAEEKRKKYNAVGVKAYQPEPSQKPRPNTRFLLNVVKATDSHNQAVIRANEQNVARWRRERLERDDHTRKRSRQIRSPSPIRSQPKTPQEPVPVRGRGKTRLHGSSMDKYFSKGYNPLLDIMDSDQEEEKQKKKKHKSEKKSKKKKKKEKKSSKKKSSSDRHREKSSRDNDNSSSSSSSSNESDGELVGPKPPRTWDIGKEDLI